MGAAGSVSPEVFVAMRDEYEKKKAGMNYVCIYTYIYIYIYS